MPTTKTIKGEKYIYLAMGYRLAKENGGKVIIGNDSGMKGGEQYQRRFNIVEYKGETLLLEHKSSPHFADFYRTYLVIENETRPYISVYYNEDGEAGDKWTH